MSYWCFLIVRSGPARNPHPPYRRPDGRRHLLRRPSQRCGQGLPADRRRLPLPLCLGPALPQRDPGHRRLHHDQRRPPHLRCPPGTGFHRAQRQRARVLRSPRPSSLRVVPPARGDRAPNYPSPQAPVRRLRRAPAQDPARRALPRLGPNQVLREHPRDTDRPRRLPGHLQHSEAPSGPRHEGRTSADVFVRCLPKTKKSKEDKMEKAA